MTNRETVADRDFKYSERKITRRLSQLRGMGVAEIKYLARELIEGEHWKKTGRNGEIALTATAVRLICRGFDTPLNFVVVGDCLLTEPVKKKDSATAVLALPPAPITMRMMRRLHNPRVLDAVDPAGKVCHVIVVDASRYDYGCEFTALPSQEHQGFYEVITPPTYQEQWRNNRHFTK